MSLPKRDKNGRFLSKAAPVAVRQRRKRIVITHNHPKRQSPWDAAGQGRFRFINQTEAGATPNEADQRAMRGRFRAMARNDGLIAGGKKTFTTNVITHKMSPQSQCVEDKGYTPPRYKGKKIRKPWADNARAGFEWGWRIFSAKMTVDGRAFEDFAWQVSDRLWIDGEVFVHKVAKKNRSFATAFEIIEPNRIGTPSDYSRDEAVSHGIRYKDGEPSIYYVAKSHFGIGMMAFHKADFDKIPAKDMRHAFRRDMAGQTRGVSDLHSVLQLAKNRKDLDDATILKMQKAASITGIATVDDPEAVNSALSEGDVDYEGDNTYANVPVDPGTFMVIPNLDSVEEFDSSTPTDTYKPFMDSTKAEMGTGLGFSRLSLTKEGEDANYSSMRGLYLGDRMWFYCSRNFLARNIFNWIWECYCDEAVLAGWVDCPLYLDRRFDYVRVSWRYGAFGWVDPKKEMAAQVEGVNADIVSLDDVCQSAGQDAEDVIRKNLEMKKFKQELAKEMGVDITPVDEKAEVEKKPNGDDEKEGGEKEEKPKDDDKKKETKDNE